MNVHCLVGKERDTFHRVTYHASSENQPFTISFYIREFRGCVASSARVNVVAKPFFYVESLYITSSDMFAVFGNEDTPFYLFNNACISTDQTSSLTMPA